VPCDAGARYAITYSDGVARHPAAAYEMIFDLAVGAAFIFMVNRRIARGQLFSIFLILYGGFRFTSEFWRETPRLYGGWLSGYQVLSLVAALLGVTFIVKRKVAWASRPRAMTGQFAA